MSSISEVTRTKVIVFIDNHLFGKGKGKINEDELQQRSFIHLSFPVEELSVILVCYQTIFNLELLLFKNSKKVNK